MKNTPNENDEGLTMLRQQHNKTKKRLKHLEKEEVPYKITNKNSSNLTDKPERTPQPEGQNLLKNAKSHAVRRQRKKRGEDDKGA